MSGETNLRTLLASLSPKLVPGEFVSAAFENARYGDYAELQPIAAATEEEGLTLVVPRVKADEKGIPYDSVFRGISLSVHSSLEAIGLTAAVAAKLTDAGISANFIAGFYHDHIFVQAGLAESALEAIAELSEAI